MSVPSPDDELLDILLTNLRNAAATFGEGTPPYESIRTTVEEHVKAMKAAGSKTNVSGMRRGQVVQEVSGAPAKEAPIISSLAFRPKPTK